MGTDEGSMAELAYEQLQPAKRRRLVPRASLRALAITTVLVALYYALPLDEQSDAWTVTQLVLGLVALAEIMAWQVRAIIGSEFPRVRVLQALFIAVPFYVLTFAAAYFLIAGVRPCQLRRAVVPHRRPVLHRHRAVDGRIRWTSPRRARSRAWSSPCR
jgi:hypothetical protein